MSKYVTFSKIDRTKSAKHLGYLAFAFQCARDQVRAAREMATGVLHDKDLTELLKLEEDLRCSALALETDFDRKTRLSHGRLFGDGGGFAHRDSTTETVAEYVEAGGV